MEIRRLTQVAANPATQSLQQRPSSFYSRYPAIWRTNKSKLHFLSRFISAEKPRLAMIRSTLVRRLPYPNHAPPTMFPPLPAVPPGALPQVDAPTKLQKSLQLTGFILATGQSFFHRRIVMLSESDVVWGRIDILLRTTLRFRGKGSLLRSRQSHT